MARVYFGCSIRGGYPHVQMEDIAQIVHEIKDLGYTLMSELTTRKKAGDNGKKHDTLIHDRDYAWIKKADFGVFEISNPSLGAGAEIADMVRFKKPVLCLYRRGLKDNLSKYISGKHGSKFVKSPFECYEYHTLGEAKYAIKRFAEKYGKK